MTTESQNFPTTHELDGHELDQVSGGTSDVINAVLRGAEKGMEAARDDACSRDAECSRGLVH